MQQLARLLTGRKIKWAWVVIGLLCAGLMTPFAGESTPTNDQTAFLPNSSQSTQVVEQQKQFQTGQTVPAVIVYARSGHLTAADRAKISADSLKLASYSRNGQIAPPTPSQDGQAVIVSFELDNSVDITPAVGKIRALVQQNLPAGLQASVTGPAGFAVDQYTAFSGVNGKLLLGSVIVVAVLLLFTYRSPWLWLVPLIVVGMSSQVATGIVNELGKHGLFVLNGENTGILRVLVFGAATDYALLIIARYREELHRVSDRHEAMRVAWRQAAPAILASGLTVTLAMLSLLLAVLNSDRSLAIVGAVGIITALVFSLVILPPALLLFGRWLFWPRIPKLDNADPAVDGIFARLGRLIARYPIISAVITIALLCAMTLGAFNIKIGLTQTQTLRGTPDSISGQPLIAAHYDAGLSSPLTVIAARNQADAVIAKLRADSHVKNVIPAGVSATRAQLDLILSDDPDSPVAYETIKRLRTAVGVVPDADAIIGGSSAIDLDTNTAAAHDRLVVMPVILAIVFVVLALLLRSIAAPLILMATVVLSFGAALGASHYVYLHVFNFPAVDAVLPLLGFVFLVALGVDYNIFLVTRAAEEVERHGPTLGMKTALAVTGAVITSAGLVLAATFAVLSILPLVILTQLGFLVGFGVLLDTLVVRSVLVPALAMWFKRAFWWPRFRA